MSQYSHFLVSKPLALFWQPSLTSSPPRLLIFPTITINILSISYGPSPSMVMNQLSFAINKSIFLLPYLINPFMNNMQSVPYFLGNLQTHCFFYSSPLKALNKPLVAWAFRWTWQYSSDVVLLGSSGLSIPFLTTSKDPNEYLQDKISSCGSTWQNLVPPKWGNLPMGTL